MPPTDSQPQAVPPKRSRLRGCLILLLVPLLILGILYAYLLCIPTGYDKQKAWASHVVRDEILMPRLKPRQTVLHSDPNSKATLPPGQEERPVPSSSSPTSKTLLTDVLISDDETLFWWNARLRLEEKDVLFSQYGATESVPWGYYMFAPLQKLNNPTPSDWITDSTTGGWTLSSPALKFFEKERSSLNSRGIEDRLRLVTTATLVRNDPSPTGSDSPYPISPKIGGQQTVRQMNQTERLLLEAGWEKADCFRSLPNESGGKGYRDPCREEYRVILAIYRAFREEKPEKASQLIERCVLSSGRNILSGHDTNAPIQPRKMKSLERVLSWVAGYPETPEEILDWTATTLASWELTPQEYTDLRAANIAQDRQKVDICFRKWDKAMNGWHLFLSGTPEKITTRLAEPFFQRSLDRKTAALINLDPAEYERAHKNLQWAMRAINFASKPSNYLDAGILIEVGEGDYQEPPYYRFLIMDEMAQNNMDRPQEDAPPSAFAEMALREKFRAGLFNRTIQMLRLSFATARYRRDHGRTPGSVQELIPRYLDESFTPNSDRFWTLIPVEPFTALTLPPAGAFSGPVAEGFSHYFKDPGNKGEIPSGIEDLKPYIPEGTDLSQFVPCFARVEKSLLYCLVIRHDPALYDQIQQAVALVGEPVPSQMETGFRYQYFSIPPGNFEEGVETSPGNVNLPTGAGKK